jgi:hypothetical protein
MRLLPPRDDDYRGSPFAVAFLWLLVAVNLFRGGVHVFASDSGAARIGGLDLSQGGAAIVSLLAAVGVDQLAWAAILAGVLVRWRRWIPLVLAVLLAKQLAAVWLLWAWKPLPVDVPGKFGALAALPLVAGALWLSLRERPARSAPG